MANAPHTPAPWLLDVGISDAAVHAGGTIAMIDDTMAGWQGNARLIAAAPDLLAALEAVLETHSATGGSAKAAAAQAAAAIAKAKGE